jgi:hypothetical protein
MPLGKPDDLRETIPNNAATQPPVAFGSRRLVAADVRQYESMKCGLSILLCAVAMVLGCARTPDAQDQCVRNTEKLWEACRSYHLSESISSNQPIDPVMLHAHFAPEDANMKCPLGTTSYAPFSYHVGPVCPNSKEHTKALRQTSAGR